MGIQSRRDFLKNSAWLSLAAAAGCQVNRFGFGAGAPMAGFAAPPIKHIRIGFVGVGCRGTFALRRLALFPGVEVAAICDINPVQMKKNRDYLAEKKLKPAKEFFGPEAYKDLCQWDGCDVVYTATPWKLHEPVSVAAMEGNKHVMVEVPATMTIDGCWNLVETSERTRRHCMLLENCCYGEMEMLMLNMCRLGLLGEPVFGGAGYIHSTDGMWIKRGPSWRNEWYRDHMGNHYPTHGLGPVSQAMNINRGDQYDYVVSVETDSIAPKAYGKAKFPADSWQANLDLKSGDYNTSIIRTKNGRAIYLSLSIFPPHPYSRINMFQGTKGVFMDYPLRIDFANELGKDCAREFDLEKSQRYRELYKHPMWKDVGEIAKKVGGHGGMDFIMDLRWVYCLQNGLPLDMDVYDLAAWSSLCEVTEKSVKNRSRPVDIPDFTRGAWRNMKPLGIETIDATKIDFKSVGGAGPQQTI